MRENTTERGENPIRSKYRRTNAYTWTTRPLHTYIHIYYIYTYIIHIHTLSQRERNVYIYIYMGRERRGGEEEEKERKKGGEKGEFGEARGMNVRGRVVANA